MEKLTRRDLIKQVSAGAGMVGLLATTAACASPTDAQAAGTSTGLTNASTASTDPIAILVTDPARGTLVILRGTSEITVNNPDLAQKLLSL